MKNFKRFISVFLIGIFLIAMSGCGTKKVTLDEAFENTSKIESYKFNADLKFNLDGDKVDPQAKMVLEGLNLNFNGSVKQEKNQLVQMDTNFKFNVLGMNMDLKVLADMVMDKDNFKYKLFVEVPEIAKASLGPVIQNAKYLYLNMDSKTLKDQLGATGQEMPEFDKAKFEKFGNSLLAFINEYKKNNEKDFITEKENQEIEINGEKEKLQVFEIKVDHEGLKKFLKAYLSNENNIKELKEFMSSFENANMPSDLEIAENIQKAIDEIDKMPKFISDKGITITFGVKDGYIVKQIFDINLDVEGQKIGYNVTMDMFDINKKVEIEFPDETSPECVDFMDLAEQMGGLPY